MFSVRVGSIKSSSANVSISITDRDKDPVATPKKKSAGGAGEGRGDSLKRRPQSSRRVLKASPSMGVLKSPESRSDKTVPDMRSSTYSQVQKQSRTFMPHHLDRLDPADLL